MIISKTGTGDTAEVSFPGDREARLLLSIARWVVNGRRSPEIKEILLRKDFNWDDFNALLAYHDFSSFACSCLEDNFSIIPAGESGLLKNARHYLLLRLAELENELSRIVDFLDAGRIDFLPIKGSSFLVDNMYGDKSGLRPMADIDILVKKDCLARIEGLLASAGYCKELCGLKEDYWKKKSYHIAFSRSSAGSRPPLVVEAHWLLDYPGKRTPLECLWVRSKTACYGGREVSILSPEDMLFCLALHLRRFGNVLSLKSACDFACLLSRDKEMDWDYILREAGRGRMRVSLSYRLIQADLFFGIKAPAGVLGALGLSGMRRKYIERFISNNTFLTSGDRKKQIFLINHFLVYDDLWQPVNMIINIPQEQFAKFYQLAPYSKRTVLLHRLRLFFYLYRCFCIFLKPVTGSLSSFFRKIFPRLRMRQAGDRNLI
ncbi:MAG: nucleotidyltransferase family protein [Candidatus Omnitrophica bacterium]|nr:nucleotidyltransferase family protein [Candidatus Omnitrophota bacterium]